MKVRGVIYAVLFVLLAFTVLATTVDHEVTSKINEDKEASVIVILEDPEPSFGVQENSLENKKEKIQEDQQQVLKKLNIKDNASTKVIEEYDLVLERQYTTVNGFSANVTKGGLEKLKKDPNVKAVLSNKVFHTTLDSSLPIIQANEVHNLTIQGSSLNGTGQTICVIDTGIDTDHIAFTGRILDQHCYCSVTDLGNGGCCPNNASEDSNAEDGQGHGTHATGIAAGDHETYKGVAPGAGIVSIKVCDNAKYASCNTADIIAAIDWCTNNATKYNISVISMSLGDASEHNSYCPTSSIAPAINSAFGSNISVVVAAGNSGHTAGISEPACVENATPVGAVTDSGSMKYNRGSILDLVAPGWDITAPIHNGGFDSKSGTSMATPHVAGAIAIFRQYWQAAYNISPLPSAIDYKLKITGDLIDDSSSSRNYSRINILNAIKPFINYTQDSQENGSLLLSGWALVNITSDVNISTALLEWNYGNGTTKNFSMIKDNGTNYYYNITNVTTPSNSYQVYGNDSANLFGISTQRIALTDFLAPQVTINSPTSSANLSSSTYTFNVTVNDSSSIDSVLFNITNGLNSTISEASNTNDFWNTIFNLSELEQGVYLFQVIANDSLGFENNSQTINFTIDRTPPVVNLEISNASNLSIAEFRFNFTDNLFSTTNCTLYLNSTKYVSSIVANATSSNITLNSPPNGNYGWNVTCKDNSQNIGQSATYNVFIDSKGPSVVINSPSSNSKHSAGLLNLNASISDALLAIDTVIFNVTNSSGSTMLLPSQEGNDWNITLNLSTLEETTHILHVITNDSFGNVNDTQMVRFIVDRTPPTVSSISSGSPSQTTATITWTTNEDANSTINYGTSSGLGTILSNSVSTTSHSISISGLTASTTYSYNVTSCDSLNYCQTNGTLTFTTASESSSSSGGGSGGGGGGGPSSNSNDEQQAPLDTSELQTQETLPPEVESIASQGSAKEGTVIEDNKTLELANDQNNPGPLEEKEVASSSPLLGAAIFSSVANITKKNMILASLFAFILLLLVLYLFVRKK